MNQFKGYLSKIAVALSVFIAVLLFQNCGGKNFNTTSTSATGFFNSESTNGQTSTDTFDRSKNDSNPGISTDTQGPNCRQQLNSATLPLNILFIVDESGSNIKDAKGYLATDPSKSIRGGSIQSFFNSFSGKSNFKWAFEVFSQDSSLQLVDGVFGSASKMKLAIEEFAKRADDGNTPYSVALSDAASFLRSQVQMESDKNSKYIVVFLSDGMPNPAIADSRISNLVYEIVNIAPGRVSFNTVYYGHSSQDSHDRLKMMATSGGGNFLDTNANSTGGQFQISDLVILPGVTCSSR